MCFCIFKNHKEEDSQFCLQKRQLLCAVKDFLTSCQSFLHLDCTEGWICRGRQGAQVIRTEGNSQERSHGDELQDPLFSEINNVSTL